jgi:hypothetical protein
MVQSRPPPLHPLLLLRRNLRLQRLLRRLRPRLPLLSGRPSTQRSALVSSKSHIRASGLRSRKRLRGTLSACWSAVIWSSLREQAFLSHTPIAARVGVPTSLPKGRSGQGIARVVTHMRADRDWSCRSCTAYGLDAHCGRHYRHQSE